MMSFVVSDLPTAEEVMDWARSNPDELYYIHRHAGEHDTGETCWCSPLKISRIQLLAHSPTTLQRELDSLFRVH